jgi:hypothetical protein
MRRAAVAALALLASLAPVVQAGADEPGGKSARTVQTSLKAVRRVEACARPALAPGLKIKKRAPRVNGLPAKRVKVALAVAQQGKTLHAPARAQAIAVSVVLAGDLLSGPGAAQFYRRLVAVKKWQGLPPSIAAHRALGTPDPFAYEGTWSKALQLLTLFSSRRVPDMSSQVSPGRSAPRQCYASPADKSALPLPAGTTFSVVNEAQVRAKLSDGSTPPAAATASQAEFQAPCGTPVIAVNAGTADVQQGDSETGPWVLSIRQSSGKVTTVYSHILQPTVKDGATVLVGQEVAEVGDLGDVGRCTLGLGITAKGRSGSKAVNPVEWLAARFGVEASKPVQIPETTFRFGTFNVLGSHLTGPGGDRSKYGPGPARMAASMGVIESTGISVIVLNELETPAASVIEGDRDWVLYRAAPNNTFRDGNTNGNGIAWRADKWTLVVGQAKDIIVPWSVTTLHMPVVTLRNLDTNALVTFMGVHNPASTDKQGNQSGARDVARSIELEAISSLLSASDTTPVLIAGDMNERREAFCGFTGSGLLHSSAGGSSGGSCQMPRHGPVDWIFGTHSIDFGSQYINNGTLGRLSDHPMLSVPVTIAAHELPPPPTGN